MLQVTSQTPSGTILAGNNVYAIAQLDNRLFVARERKKVKSNNIDIYDVTNLQQLPSLNIPNLGSYPHSLAACSVSRYLFISDYDKGKIHRAHLDTSNDVNNWEVAKYPIGVSATSKGNVLVTYHSRNVLSRSTSTHRRQHQDWCVR